MSERNKKILNTLLSALWWAFLAVLVLLMVQIIGAKAEGRVPKIFGYSVMQIITGSMEDTIPTGSYILVKEIPADEVKKDDIISFYSDDIKIYGMPNTHRVVDIKETEEGLEFVTRGDANSANDRVSAKSDKLIGVYVANLNALNDFADFLENGGIYAIIAFIWISTAFMMGYTIYKRKKNEE